MKIKGFTIIELIVVMAIIGVLGGVLSLGLVRFRQNIQQQQAMSDFLSNLRLAQNMARNGVLSEVKPRTSGPLDAIADAYAIYFTATNYSLRYCVRTGSQYNCSGIEKNNLKLPDFSQVNITVNSASKCQGIVFERLTGNISAANAATANIDNVGSCTITIQHQLGQASPPITINFANDSIRQ